jgi:hypothetical protein
MYNSQQQQYSQNSPLGERDRNERLVHEGRCTICQKTGVYTEFHHIITPNQAPQHKSKNNIRSYV